MEKEFLGDFKVWKWNFWLEKNWGKILFLISSSIQIKKSEIISQKNEKKKSIFWKLKENNEQKSTLQFKIWFIIKSFMKKILIFKSQEPSVDTDKKTWILSMLSSIKTKQIFAFREKMKRSHFIGFFCVLNFVFHSLGRTKKLNFFCKRFFENQAIKLRNFFNSLGIFFSRQVSNLIQDFWILTLRDFSPFILDPLKVVKCVVLGRQLFWRN